MASTRPATPQAPNHLRSTSRIIKYAVGGTLTAAGSLVAFYWMLIVGYWYYFNEHTFVTRGFGGNDMAQCSDILEQNTTLRSVAWSEEWYWKAQCEGNRDADKSWFWTMFDFGWDYAAFPALSAGRYVLRLPYSKPFHIVSDYLLGYVDSDGLSQLVGAISEAVKTVVSFLMQSIPDLSAIPIPELPLKWSIWKNILLYMLQSFERTLGLGAHIIDVITSLSGEDRKTYVFLPVVFVIFVHTYSLRRDYEIKYHVGFSPQAFCKVICDGFMIAMRQNVSFIWSAFDMTWRVLKYRRTQAFNLMSVCVLSLAIALFVYPSSRINIFGTVRTTLVLATLIIGLDVAAQVALKLFTHIYNILAFMYAWPPIAWFRPSSVMFWTTTGYCARIFFMQVAAIQSIFLANTLAWSLGVFLGLDYQGFLLHYMIRDILDANDSQLRRILYCVLAASGLLVFEYPLNGIFSTHVPERYYEEGPHYDVSAVPYNLLKVIIYAYLPVKWPFQNNVLRTSYKILAFFRIPGHQRLRSYVPRTPAGYQSTPQGPPITIGQTTFFTAIPLLVYIQEFAPIAALILALSLIGLFFAVAARLLDTHFHKHTRLTTNSHAPPWTTLEEDFWAPSAFHLQAFAIAIYIYAGFTGQLASELEDVQLSSMFRLASIHILLLLAFVANVLLLSRGITSFPNWQATWKPYRRVQRKLSSTRARVSFLSKFVSDCRARQLNNLLVATYNGIFTLYSALPNISSGVFALFAPVQEWYTSLPVSARFLTPLTSLPSLSSILPHLHTLAIAAALWAAVTLAMYLSLVFLEQEMALKDIMLLTGGSLVAVTVGMWWMEWSMESGAAVFLPRVGGGSGSGDGSGPAPLTPPTSPKKKKQKRHGIFTPGPSAVGNGSGSCTILPVPPKKLKWSSATSSAANEEGSSSTSAGPLGLYGSFMKSLASGSVSRSGLFPPWFEEGEESDNAGPATLQGVGAKVKAFLVRQKREAEAKKSTDATTSIKANGGASVLNPFGGPVASTSGGIPFGPNELSGWYDKRQEAKSGSEIASPGPPPSGPLPALPKGKGKWKENNVPISPSAATPKKSIDAKGKGKAKATTAQDSSTHQTQKHAAALASSQAKADAVFEKRMSAARAFLAAKKAEEAEAAAFLSSTTAETKVDDVTPPRSPRSKEKVVESAPEEEAKSEEEIEKQKAEEERASREKLAAEDVARDKAARAIFKKKGEEARDLIDEQELAKDAAKKEREERVKPTLTAAERDAIAKHEEAEKTEAKRFEREAEGKKKARLQADHKEGEGKGEKKEAEKKRPIWLDFQRTGSFKVEKKKEEGSPTPKYWGKPGTENSPVKTEEEEEVVSPFASRSAVASPIGSAKSVTSPTGEAKAESPTVKSARAAAKVRREAAAALRAARAARQGGGEGSSVISPTGSIDSMVSPTGSMDSESTMPPTRSAAQKKEAAKKMREAREERERVQKELETGDQ